MAVAVGEPAADVVVVELPLAVRVEVVVAAAVGVATSVVGAAEVLMMRKTKTMMLGPELLLLMRLETGERFLKAVYE